MVDDRIRDHAKSYQMDPNPPTKRGVFVIHGFASNPDVFRPYAQKFVESGFHTYVARIHGHGTTPEHFATTNRFEWKKSITEQFVTFSNSMKEVIVIGHSLGALHAIEIASNFKLLSLVLLSPPIKPKSKLLIKLHPLIPIISKVKKFWPVPKKKVKLLRERGADIYEKHPLLAFYEMVKLIEEIQSDLPKIQTRSLLVLGEEDEFVAQETLEIIEKSLLQHEIEYVKWRAPKASHALIDTSDYDALENLIVEFVRNTK